MTIKIVVMGSRGQLGRELLQPPPLPGHHLKIEGVSHHELDITHKEAIPVVLNKLRPDLIINATAYTAVDKAEVEREKAMLINHHACAYLADFCAKESIPLIHISTDYVFDGLKDGPYIETDPVNPINTYGLSKEAGEQEIRKRLEKHLILRTAWMYSAHGKNFVKTILKLLSQKNELRIVADQFSGPTSAKDLAQVILSLAPSLVHGNPSWGTYHYCGEPKTSWHHFAETIIRLKSSLHGQKINLIPIPTSDYPLPARRPANSELNCDKIRQTFQITRPHWEESLKNVLETMT